MDRISITKKDYSALESARIIWKALRSEEMGDQWLGLDDIVVLTGLPEADARQGVLMLVGLSDGSFREQPGRLEFQFEPSDTPLWFLQLPSKLQRLWRWLRRALARTYAPMLLVGILLFTIGWMASLEPFIELLASEAPDIISSYAYYAAIAGWLVWSPWVLLVGAMGTALWICGVMTVERGVIGLLMSLPGPIVVGALNWYCIPRLFRWYSWVFDHVIRGLRTFSDPFNFGRVHRHELHDERVFLSLLGERDGRLTLGDLMVLYGWTRQRAFEQVTQLLLDYGGDIEVDEQGRMVFDFTDLVQERDVESQNTEPPLAYRTEKPPTEIFDVRAKLFDFFALFLWLALTIPHLWLVISDFQAVADTLQASPLINQVFWAVAVVLTLVVPIYVLVRRLVVAWRQWKYEDRRRLLDWLRRADQANGRMHLAPDDIDTEMIHALGATVGIEPDDQGRLPVDIPAMQLPSQSQAVTDVSTGRD